MIPPLLWDRHTSWPIEQLICQTADRRIMYSHVLEWICLESVCTKPWTNTPISSDYMQKKFLFSIAQAHFFSYSEESDIYLNNIPCAWWKIHCLKYANFLLLDEIIKMASDSCLSWFLRALLFEMYLSILL